LTSEIVWADNLYLTVVDEFGLWAKHPSLIGTTLEMMDYLTSYDTQHSDFAPVPVLGPDAVLWLSGATVSITPSAASSWVPGSTIASYEWQAVGASATSGLTTATPTITYDAAGVYRLRCTVTAANGEDWEGFRKVFVFELPSTGSPSTGSGDEVVKALEKEFEDWEENRAGVIAKAESVRVNGAVSQFVYLAAGALFLTWRTFNDSCPYCKSLNGKRVGINEMFLAMGEELLPEGVESGLRVNHDVGHPPAHSGCDCMISAG
jgi:hypothetical protein